MRIRFTAILLLLIGSVQIQAQDQNASLHCLADQVQMQNRAVHFGQGSEDQIFLLRNQYDDPLVIDFPQGHQGASAGLTQVLAPRAWAVYVYKAKADGLMIENENRRVFWSCANQLSDVLNVKDCQQSLWICALSPDSAKILLSSHYQAEISAMSRSFWLALGNSQYQSLSFLSDLQK